MSKMFISVIENLHSMYLSSLFFLMNFRISHDIVCHYMAEVNVAERKYLNSIFCLLFLFARFKLSSAGA